MLRAMRRAALKIAYRLSKRRYLELLLLLDDRRIPSLKNPRTFNEKLNAYKLATVGNPLMVQLADKIEVKSFVADRIGKEHLIPTLWYGETLPARETRDWPKPYVIKSSHGSGHTIFVRDAEPDWDGIEATTSAWLQQKFGRYAYEWPYLEMKPRLLIEPFTSEGDEAPADYKFFCFDGEPKIVQIDVDRHTDHRRGFYDLNWRPIDLEIGKPGPTNPVERPRHLSEMIRIAGELSRDIPFVRVDLYEVADRILFGEMTFFPDGGMNKFKPRSAQSVFSDLWDYRLQ